MAFTITLHPGHTFTAAEAITIDKLNKLFSLGYATVDSGSVDTANIANEAVTVDKMADLTRGSIITGQTASNRPAALDAKTSGYILVGDGTDLKSVAVSGMIALSAAGAVTIPLARGSILSGQTSSNLAAALNAKSAGYILIGDGTDINSVAVSGDISISQTGVVTLNSAHSAQRASVQIEDLGVGVDISTARPIFVDPAYGATITTIGILTQGTPAGIDDSNTVVIDIKDEGGNSLVTKTYNSANQPPTNDYASLGAIDPTHGVLAAGEHVTITVTQGATANMPAFMIIFIYQPSNV